jgi:hypothetical protein
MPQCTSTQHNKNKENIYLMVYTYVKTLKNLYRYKWAFLKIYRKEKEIGYLILWELNNTVGGIGIPSTKTLCSCNNWVYLVSLKGLPHGSM